MLNEKYPWNWTLASDKTWYQSNKTFDYYFKTGYFYGATKDYDASKFDYFMLPNFVLNWYDKKFLTHHNFDYSDTWFHLFEVIISGLKSTIHNFNVVVLINNNI